MNERLQNIVLFTIPALIWGSTWYVIKFQLGFVSPIVSVAYRFFVAGLLLFIICLLLGYRMRYSYRAHGLFFLLGISLFGINYWLVYAAEQYLTSGLIAVMFSLIVFANMLISAIMLRTKVRKQVLLGGLLAIGGTTLIFKKELLDLSGDNGVFPAIIMSLSAVLLASFGNVLSAYNQRVKLPVIQANAYGMLYGASTVLLISLVKGAEIVFDPRREYILSLIYLSVFGSIVAFTSYLKLIGRIGAPKASYIVVIVPVIAMVFSTIFESYQWQQSALLGMPVLILGNLIAMDKLKYKKLKLKWK
jgi:drug/metabolite transporter (DMT)-like permease